MKKALLIIFFSSLFLVRAYAQSNQEKAQALVIQYLSNKSNSKTYTHLKFNALEVLRSSFADTKQYRNYQHKIDSLKLEGRKIDARAPKMKTTGEINQIKTDSKNLSNQLTSKTDEIIDFMTSYKGKQIGWMISTVSNNRNAAKKTFYLNTDLTKVDSVK